MKKLRIFTVALCAMALAMGGTSCNKEKENNIQSGDRMVIGAGINQGGDGQKTHLGENGDKVDILWSKGDSFMLYAGESTDGQTFTIKGEGGATTADFEGAAPGSAPYYAFYPSDGVTRNSEYEFTYTLPKEVEYETLPDHAGPMIGYSKDGSSAMFTAATPALYLSLTGDVKVSKVELTDKNDAKLDGTLTATFNVVNDEVTSITSTVTAGTSSKLTVTMKNGIQLRETPVVFSFPIPVEVFNGDNSAEIVVTYEGGSKTITGGITGGAQLGVAYGKAAEIKATTLPEGALPGVFSVSATKKVHFSQGNLYAKKDNGTWSWHFYDNQYGYNSLNSGKFRTAQGADCEIDLFTWGFSTSTSLNPIGQDYVTSHTNVFDVLDYEHSSSEGGDDWGVAYCESNEVAVGTWRTLTITEWQYLFDNHNNKKINVCGKTGYAIAPDGVSADAIAASYNTDTEWKTAQDAGIVFLPAAGYRSGFQVLFVGDNSRYWSSSAWDELNAYHMSSNSSYYEYGSRFNGRSVRLITEAK